MLSSPVELQGATVINEEGNNAIDGLEQSLVTGAVAEFDAQISQMGDQIENKNEKKAEYREMESYIDGVLSNPTVEGEEGQTQVTLSSSEAQELKEIAKDLNQNGEHAKLIEAINSAGDGGIVVDKKVIEGLLSTVQGEVDALNSSAELQMIRFQSLMDSRKQAMLMLSNMVNSQNQTMQAIIQNIKG